MWQEMKKEETIFDAIVTRAHAYVNVHSINSHSSDNPLIAIYELRISLRWCDEMIAVVGKRMSSRSTNCKAIGSGQRVQLFYRCSEISVNGMGICTDVGLNLQRALKELLVKFFIITCIQ